MAQYKLYAVKLLRAADSPVVPVSAMGAEPNVETGTDESGAPTVLTRFVTGVDPRLSFTTKQWDRVLSAVDPRGSCVHPDRTLKGVEGYYRKLATCKDDVVTSTSHAKVSMSHGLATPLELSSAGRNAAVVLTGEAHGFSVGGNASLAANPAVALPGFAPADLYEYVAGAVRLGGVAFGTMQTLNLSFGNRPSEKEQQLAGLEPENGAFDMHDPTLTLAARDVRQFGPTAVPFGGLAAEHETTEIWFRRRAKGAGGFVPPSTPAHARLRMTGLLTCTDAGSGSGGLAGTQFRVESQDDGVHQVLDWATGIPYAPSFTV